MVDIPKLGKLTDVDLREAWPHEAHSFTPWLAENLDALAAALGMSLELVDREVSVDQYFADILARDPTDDSLVLIENQLEPTDHTHLGQILTYLAGLDARIVVWVARSFRDPHLSAIRWLNENTVEPFAFFAIQVKVVRIEESRLAPVFEVLERPNEWDRRLHAVTRSKEGLTDIGRFRRDFWAFIVARAPDFWSLKEDFAASSVWMDMPMESIRLVCYLGQKEIGVFLRGPRGESPEAVHAQLSTVVPETWDSLGVTLAPASSGHFCGKSLRIDTRDEANWSQMADWMDEQHDLYRDALEAGASS